MSVGEDQLKKGICSHAWFQLHVMSNICSRISWPTSCFPIFQETLSSFVLSFDFSLQLHFLHFLQDCHCQLDFLHVHFLKDTQLVPISLIMFPSFFQFSLFWQIATQNDVSYEQREVANNKEWSCKWKRNDEIDRATTYFATFQCLTARPSPESWCHEWYSTRHCFARCLIRLQCFFEPWNNKRSHEMPKMQVVCASDAKRPSSLGVLMFSEA